MRDTLGKSLKNLKWLRIQKTRITAILLVLSLVVSLDVFWALRQPGLTLAGDATCGILEHTHDDACGTSVCICDLSEEPHLHDETCYETRFVEAKEIQRLICEETEEPHFHSERCYETFVTELGEETVLMCDRITEPHEHTDDCFVVETEEAYEEQILICDLSEEGHTHEDACYEWEVICDLEEHVHSISCYSDDTADVESQLDWQAMFADYPYTEKLREDLVGIAQTQVGYTESELNFTVDHDGDRHGYTRYGAWYGSPYSDWSAMFVSFCLNYAGADPEENPGNTGADSMAKSWKKLGKYADAEEYTPEPGDLVFFTDNTVGIVAEVQHATCYVIRGDVEDEVRGEVILLEDTSIAGWGLTEGTILPEEELEPLPEEIEQIEEIEELEEEDFPDLSDGPVFRIFASKAKEEARPWVRTLMTWSARTVAQDEGEEEITDLLAYLNENDGSYFFTLLDKDNHQLPTDANGNFIAQAGTGYNLTISFNSPEGFLPGTYQYQVPNGLMVDGGAGDFVLKDGENDGIYVGNWEVTDTGLITLYFNEDINSHTEITISATMGIHFPEQEDPVDFDGKIIVTVEPPPQQQDPTVLQKWGQPDADAGKLDWIVLIKGRTDSQIPGSIITDQVGLPDWGKPHSYTQSDIDAGLTFGVTDANGGWHNWTVTADDPHLIWDENGWSYKIPQTVVCDYCGELELGNNGWEYQINYSSTPTPLNTPGNFAYENKVTVDGQTAWGWNEFVHGQIAAQIIKNGDFVSNAGGGSFLWEIQASIPGRPEGQRAEYSWAISDEMRLLDQNGIVINRLPNDIHLATVTAIYNGTTIQIPRIQDATDQDMFAWDNAWTSDGIPATRTINLLCRCQCTPETCHWGGCGEYWYKNDAGVTVGTRDFCQCWTETQNMTFTLVYKTTDLAMIEAYGALGYEVNNQAQLYYIGDNNATVQVGYDDASVDIPNLFEKQLTHDFNGYTANYKITVNEGKVALTNGTPLTIHDVMTDTLAYISGSLVITTEDANGNIKTLQQGVDYNVYYDGTGNATNDYGDSVHVLDIVILHPHPVMYILDYDTTLIMPEHVTAGIKYQNSATITLWGEDIKDTTAEKVYADINISAKSYKVELYKTAALTDEPLPGATFGLYNEHGGLIATEVSDANGELFFQTNVVEGIILREHKLYYMQELQAPPGYRLDDTKHWFCFCNKKDDSCAVCAEIIAEKNAFRIPFEQIGLVRAANEIMSYDLPSTGGAGIYPIILVGAGLILTPLIYRFIRRRKQERRGVG